MIEEYVFASDLEHTYITKIQFLEDKISISFWESETYRHSLDEIEKQDIFDVIPAGISSVPNDLVFRLNDGTHYHLRIGSQETQSEILHAFKVWCKGDKYEK